jgi:hypothetical protein
MGEGIAKEREETSITEACDPAGRSLGHAPRMMVAGARRVRRRRSFQRKTCAKAFSISGYRKE